MTSDRADGRQAYFEALYGGDADPWRYEAGEYEIVKRRDTLDFLQESYGRACEVGCSIGVLTRDLAPRCGLLVGLDVSPKAIDLARERLKDLANVAVEVRHLPYDDLPPDLDLLVLSEMLYFLDGEEIAGLADLASRRVTPGGDLLIVSYDGETQTRLNGQQSTERFLAAAAEAFEPVRSAQREHYHVRLLRRRHVGG